MDIAETDRFEEQLNDVEPDWFNSTKEKLGPDDIFRGLLDYGLFAEKIPPCIVSQGLADFVCENLATVLDEPDDKRLKCAIGKRSHDYMRYEALRDSNIPRHMGVPHPEAYAVQVIAIAKHWQAIAVHCNNPDPQFSRIHVRRIGDGSIFEMNYKGNERYQLEEEEQKWMLGAQFMVEADIAACFPSIYTHSIPWALDGKAETKNNRSLNKSIGNLLDSCTQSTRDRQTNGLLIGPHASNVISEIILTKIDVELQQKGYRKVVRYVDDYRFYATSFDEAERFIRDLGLALRAYEMALNESKTRIEPLPCPSEANWVLILNRHPLPIERELKFSEIRSFLDRALNCAQAIGKSTPINYAIKVLAKMYVKDGTNGIEVQRPRKMGLRARRMYTQEAMNLALAYPYLAPLLDEYVFTPYCHIDLKDKVAKFASLLVDLGLKKLYPDAIAHAIFLAIKYDFPLSQVDDQLIKIVALDDCVANVMLLEYAKLRDRRKIKSAIVQRAIKLKGAVKRDIDKQWLLIYQVWSENELKGNGQCFLAGLKKSGFQFFSHPRLAEEANYR